RIRKVTCRRNTHRSAGIGAVRRTTGNAADGIQLDVGRQVARIGDGGAVDFVLFQRELVGRRVNLAEVVDARVGLRTGAGFYEVWNRDGRQEADDGHDDHDFHQREAGTTEHLGCFHFVFSFVDAV